MSTQSFVLFGNQSILAQCAGKIRESGHDIAAVVTSSDDLKNWAAKEGIQCLAPNETLKDALGQLKIDWILSLAYLSVIPAEILDLATQGAVNFHDGILPEYAGLNTPVWARINQEKEHGITWHFMEAGVDKGDIIAQHRFPISEDDTAFSLNTKCFEMAVESFDRLLGKLIAGNPSRHHQDFENRHVFGRSDRPNGFGLLDFTQSTAANVALVRALDHQNYWNPLTTPKIVVNGHAYTVATAHPTDGSGIAGEALDVTNDILTVATSDGAIALGGISDPSGAPLGASLADLVHSGQNLICDGQTTIAVSKQVAKSEAAWRDALSKMTGASVAFLQDEGEDMDAPTVTLSKAPEGDLLTAIAIVACRQQEGESATLAIGCDDEETSKIHGLINPWKPLTLLGHGSIGGFSSSVANAYEQVVNRYGFAADLLDRAPELDAIQTPDIGISSSGKLVEGTTITFDMQNGQLIFDPNRTTQFAAELIAKRINHVLGMLHTVDGSTDLGSLSIMPPEELEQLLTGWNQTELPYDPSILLHQAFETEANAHPTHTALVFDDQTYSYDALDQSANAIAQRLNALGIGRGDVVGLFIPRSPDMVIAAFGILKAGAAYLSLDPAYPSERTEYCIEDSQAKAILTHSDIAEDLPSNASNIVVIDRPESDPSGNPALETQARPDDLAYMIYTSGSTGKPKGVMVEHRQTANFFAGMDDRIPHEPAGTWLAVTSLSFDISVLEIFWTLGRGFKLVLTGEEGRTTLSNGPLPSQVQGMDFSLFYWGNDDGIGRDKYKSLLEGAKFADKNGFGAIWTPERHFHAFGGPYPNPSVTGAAVAAVTQNLSVRAGSCVAPLHHTARIAEEWSVIDNLTNGRAGLAIASGWQPDDFVLRPENTPPKNRDAMFDCIKDLRSLWKGDPVAYPKADGTMHEVITQPRPVSTELPIWVTTAGNPETWRQAGEIGANVLTHLLGQSVAEVGDKIKIYQQALRDNGYDPADFAVTLMLHTYLAEDREKAREIAREPMKDYLRSAAGLIKQYAWAFPAFKRPKNVDSAFQLDLGILNEEELEAILDFAFERYFNDSGLFGTVADAMKRVEEAKKIGVTEIACLIDYGIDADTVLDGLKPVADVVKRCNEGASLDDDDFSIAAQIIRHKVTHMQCTPSMARMFMMDDETRQAMGELKQIMLGGEALPGALVKDIQSVSHAEIHNMYGPTETTIWSTTAKADPIDGTVPIGRPIANTQVYVLDENRQPTPVGKPGELWIAGDGVTRGYWQRPDLTNERFVKDPFASDSDARMYATGDLVNWKTNGSLAYIGRTDFQVKIRGFRIELGEIEAAMNSYQDVTQSAVVMHKLSESDTRLVGFFVAKSDVSRTDFRAFLAENLPPQMASVSLVQLDDMPLTPNKKIDRNTLIAFAKKGSTPPTKKVVDPISDHAEKASVESQISEVWHHILGTDKFSLSDNFFDVGGHSLLAVQAHREIREKLSVAKLSITDIFRFPVLKDLSQRVSDLRGDASAMPATSSKRDLQPENATAKTSLRDRAVERRRALRAKRKSQ